MSPAQLQEYVLMLATPKVAPIHDSEGPEMQPTPAPVNAVNVYDRDAVIAFNEAQGPLLRPLPVPEADEEVLAHADGTVTVRKKEPSANMGL
jgi:hypothetical protein